MSDPVSAILALLPNHKPAGPNAWKSRCPAHDDRNPSLSIRKSDNGAVLLCCHAGCDITAILARLGIAKSDLFPDNDRRVTASPKSNGRAWATPEAYAADEARRLGARHAGTWHYQTADASPAMAVLRFDTSDGKTFKPLHPVLGGWAVGDPSGMLPLYRLPEVLTSTGRVYVCEGEKAADAARSIGLVATTSAHGSRATKKSDWEPLAGRDSIVLPDNDDAGRKYADDVGAILGGLNPPATVRIVRLPDLPNGGDIVDWLDRFQCRESEEIRHGIEVLADVAEPTNGNPKPVATFKSVRQLLIEFPHLRPPAIHGLLRQGETMNVIAPQKLGKSWLVGDLAIAVATGRAWLDTYMTERGDVLILDNELHGETLANRIPRIAEARGVGIDEYADHVFVDVLRGCSLDLFGLPDYFASVRPGQFRIVILDALYRFWPRDTDENDNGSVTNCYNVLDGIAGRIGCCFVLIHHASKGSQSSKAVTDVGSGAGAQSRATDTHLILRHHENAGVVALDAAVRSWPPINPTCLRWDYPIWTPAPDLDPTALRPERPRRPKPEKTAEPEPVAGPPLDEARDFVTRFLTADPRSMAAIIDAAVMGGLTERRARGLLARADGRGLAFRWRVKRQSFFATTKQPEIALGGAAK